MKHVHGGNIYTYKNCLDFSANCNPLGTPESVKQAVRDSLDHLKDYPQVGYAPLKEAIAAYEDVKPETYHLWKRCGGAGLFTVPCTQTEESTDSDSYICRI